MNNHNQCVKRFLEREPPSDYLLIMGDDSVPKGNLLDVVEKAAYRARLAGRMSQPRGGLQLSYSVSDLQEEDNLKLAQAAREIMEYLEGMMRRGWITRRKAMELAYKFAGEVVDVEAMVKELESEQEAGDGED